jgi:ubiquinone/menaquinone biosynthesis C-methylase UbiE
MRTARENLSHVEAWRKYDAVESRLTAAVSERMLDLAKLAPGMRVLDLASGRGEPALRAAKRVGPLGHVLGFDTSAEILTIARERAREEGLANIELRAGDAACLDAVPDGSFDVATARWGLMFMQEPVAALASTRRVLRPGAALVAAFWAEPERVPWATLPRRVLARYRDVPAIDFEAPGVFRYADRSAIERTFLEAGFTMTHVEELDTPVIEAPTGEGIVAWVRDLGMARLASELPEEQQLAWEAELAGELEQLRAADTIRLGGTTRLVVATALGSRRSATEALAGRA